MSGTGMGNVKHGILNVLSNPQWGGATLGLDKLAQCLKDACAAPKVYHQTNLAALDYIQSLFASPILYAEV